MDFSPSREREMLRNVVREFAEQELRPRLQEFEEFEGEWPYDVKGYLRSSTIRNALNILGSRLENAGADLSPWKGLV